MNTTSPLRLKDDERPDGQQVMPWADPGAQKLLAIPRDDIVRWRIRLDVRWPRLFAVNIAWIRDERWLNLCEIIEADQAYPRLAVLPAIGFVAYELMSNAEHIGLQPRTGNVARLIAAAWVGMADDQRLLNYAIQRALQVSMLALVDADDFATIETYGPVPEKKRGSADTAVQMVAPSGASRRHPAPSAVDVDVDGTSTSTGHDLDKKNDVDDGRTHSKQITTSNDDDERTTTASGPGPLVSGGGTHDTTEADRQILFVTPHGMEIPANVHRATAVIGEWLLAWRRVNRKSHYPKSTRDFQDLARAINAAWERGTERELVDLLAEIREWADKGSGFRTALRDAGFLSEARKRSQP
jgi:hypothetical protein